MSPARGSGAAAGANQVHTQRVTGPVPGLQERECKARPNWERGGAGVGGASKTSLKGGLEALESERRDDGEG